MPRLLPAFAVVSTVVLTSTAFAANHQGDRHSPAMRAQRAAQAQPYALTGQASDKAVIERRVAQPRPVR